MPVFERRESMKKKPTDKQTVHLSVGNAAMSVKSNPDESVTAKVKSDPWWVRFLYKLGFEVEYHKEKKEKKEKISVKQLPRLAWAGVKSAAADTRSVWLNKTAAFDKPLFVIVIVLVIVGLVMMSSASYAYSYSHYGNSMYIINKQVVATILGVMLMLLISTVHPSFLKGKWSYYLWGISLLLLVVVRILPGKKGVHRWIGVGSLSFQPSEIAKFTAILVCATYIAYHYKEINVITYKSASMKQRAARSKRFKYWYGLGRNFQTAVWPFMWRIAPILILLVLEPHLSCTIIVLLIVGTQMLLGGTRKEYFLTLLGLAALAIYLIVFLGVVPYGRTRIETWLDPFADAKGNGWQNVQSLYAISSGGIFGAGFGNSRQKYMYIAEPQNDFIFSVVCEEVGLVGAIVIILIFVAFIWRGFSLSVANPDRFQKFVGIGITSQIGYQMMLNIAVVTNMVPNTGISLPFFSSGGTSILMLLAEIGVLLAISRESPNKVM